MTEPASREDRRRAGEAARSRAPLASQAAWAPPSGRPDPVDLLEVQATTRIPELVPLRYGRMAATPLAFLRGAALPMAADLATTPASGIAVQLCGDAHLSNFGLFASPERDLLFDVTDFDETLPGPFEWDAKRLAASIVIAGRVRGFSAHEARHAVHGAMRAYRERMAAYAGMRAIEVYYARVDVAGVLGYVDRRARPYLRTTVRAAAHHDALHELPRLTEVAEDGLRRIVDRPPVISHPSGMTAPLDAAVLATYAASLQEDRRVLLDRYRVVDAARKVVGVGSVGLGAFVVLLDGDDGDDPLFLQVKEAEPSVLERYLGPSAHANHGERVVAGQRRLQAGSDILLGWAVGSTGRHLYVRQLNDQKGGGVVDAMTSEDLAAWGSLCGWALARGHARSGDPAVIAGYLGDDDTFDRAIGSFAEAYADQTERDHAALLAAIAAGRIAAETGE